MKNRIAVMIATLLLMGCTTTGFHTNVSPEIFGEYQEIRLCLYLDKGISEEYARELIQRAWQDEVDRYKLEFVVVEVNYWPRPAFTHKGIFNEIMKIPLKAPCDRIFALVGRNAGDFAWGLLLPEVLGEVDGNTTTHGFAVARLISLNQIFMPPTSVIRHEFEHLLGCGHNVVMSSCYQQIAQLKEIKRSHKLDFFPSRSVTLKYILLSREEVNAVLGGIR